MVDNRARTRSRASGIKVSQSNGSGVRTIGTEELKAAYSIVRKKVCGSSDDIPVPTSYCRTAWTRIDIFHADGSRSASIRAPKLIACSGISGGEQQKSI